jgi:transposase-like protein
VAIKRYNRIHKTGIAIWQCKYLNTIVEQDHRAVKRKMKPMLGVKSFWAARCTIAGIEVMLAIRKGQLASPGEECPTRRHNATPWLPDEKQLVWAHIVVTQNLRHNPNP